MKPIEVVTEEHLDFSVNGQIHSFVLKSPLLNDLRKIEDAMTKSVQAEPGQKQPNFKILEQLADFDLAAWTWESKDGKLMKILPDQIATHPILGLERVYSEIQNRIAILSGRMKSERRNLSRTPSSSNTNINSKQEDLPPQ